MKRCVIASRQPWTWIDQLDQYSIMIVNPDSPVSRYNYLLDKSDYSLLITDNGIQERSGGDYGNERLFWYTSGTTGDSKFYGFAQEQLDHQIDTITSAYDITANDRYVSVMPLWHAHGQGFYWAARKIGCEMHFLAGHEIKKIDAYHPTFVTAIPDFLRIIGKLSLSDLRFIRSASSPLPNDLYLDLQRRFAAPIIEAFGMTEALSHCLTNPLHGEQRIGTVGLPSGIEAKIENDHLWVRGDSVFTDQWFDTGDLAQVDHVGYYQILGRSTDRINVRGYKIDPLSIEQQLRSMVPDIGDCVVFGVDQVNCIFTGSARSEDVNRVLVSIHSCCRPRLLKKMPEIPRPVASKISRSWLCKQINDL